MVCLYFRFEFRRLKSLSSIGGRSSSVNSPSLRVTDWVLRLPAASSDAPKRAVRTVPDAVTPSHGPKCSGTVTFGANSVRCTNAGVFRFASSRCTAPMNESKLKYTGRLRQGACSTELKLASGRLRSDTLVSGLMVRKLLSFNAAKFRLKPRKLLLRKTALRTSELMASP